MSLRAYKEAEARARIAPRDQSAAAGWLSALAAPYPTLWALTAAMIALDAVWLSFSPLDLDSLSVVIAMLLWAVLFGAAALWTVVRPSPQLRAMAQSSALLFAFTSAVGVLQYLAATLSPPLIDAALAAVERAIGFDWPAHVASLNAKPWAARISGLVYHSSAPQVALVVIALSAMRLYARLAVFIRLFAATLLVAVLVSSVFPAAGAYAFYRPAPADVGNLITSGGTWHLAILTELRGSGPVTVALHEVKGLATFPSFHVSLAILTAWALWPVPVLGWLALILNAAVVLATVSAGGHYLPDIIAGAALGLSALCLRR